MDDLNDKLNRLLSSPDGMAKIQSAFSALTGSNAPVQETPSSAPPLPPLPDTKELAMVQKIMPLIGSFREEDDRTRLLKALRPFLHGEREQRLDEALRLLRLMRLLPLLQEQGILQELTKGG